MNCRYRDLREMNESGTFVCLRNFISVTEVDPFKSITVVNIRRRILKFTRQPGGQSDIV